MEDIINFPKADVNGKALYTKELIYKLEDDTLQGVYSDRTSFSNLKYSQSGFQPDMFIVSNEKIRLMRPDRRREKLRKGFSAVSLFRFELVQHKSTNAVTGCFRFISVSGKQVTAETVISNIYDIRIEDDVLKFYENQALCRDQLIQGESFKSVAFQVGHRSYSKDGKLHYEYDGKCFDMDTRTMQRSNSPDIFPPFISVEKQSRVCRRVNADHFLFNVI